MADRNLANLLLLVVFYQIYRIPAAESGNPDDTAGSRRRGNQKVSDFLRLRQSPDPTFPADKSTDVDVAKYKLPYEDEETEEEVPDKYNIIFDLPKDDKGNIAPTGFYKLEW